MTALCAIFSMIMLSQLIATSHGDDKNRQQELSSACNDGNVEKVRALLAAGVDPNIVPLLRSDAPIYASSALENAIRRGYQDIVRILVKAGARINDENSPALVAAVWGEYGSTSESSDLRMINLLIELGADVHVANEEASAAAAYRNLIILQWLVKCGANPNHKALMSAVDGNKSRTVEYLIGIGVDPKETDVDGRTLLHAASAQEIGRASIPAKADLERLWNRLLDLGVPIEAVDNKGNTPLHESAHKRDVTMTHWLLRQGANIHASNKAGQTPLMVAVQQYWQEERVVRALIEAGTKLDLRDENGLTALDYAESQHRWDYMSMLLNAGATPSDATKSLTTLARFTLGNATSLRDVLAIVEKLLPLVSSLHALKIDDIPILSWAVLLDHERVVRLLIDAGADLNARDVAGRTPLMLAALTESKGIYELLRQSGADRALTDGKGSTASRIVEQQASRSINPVSGGSPGLDLGNQFVSLSMDTSKRRDWDFTPSPMDPPGDVHPQVIVGDSGFAVVYRFNEGKKEDTTTPEWKMEFEPDGTAKLPRHRIPSELRGKWATLPSPVEDLRISTAQSEQSGKLAFVLDEKKLDQWESHKLMLDPVAKAKVTAITRVGDRVGFTWLAPYPSPFMFSAATVDGNSPGLTVEIGHSAPFGASSVSNPVWAAERWWIAWVRRSDQLAQNGDQVWLTMLTSIDPTTGEAEHQKLPGLSQWNSRPSMNTTGGWLCIAWHASIDNFYLNKAEIITAFVKLPE